MIWAIGSVVVAVVIAGLVAWPRARLDRLGARARSLEVRVAELTESLDALRGQLRLVEARTAPSEGPPARLALEAVTGPVVKAVAFSAGARRAVGRLVGQPGATR